MSLSKLPPELINDIVVWLDLIVTKERHDLHHRPMGIPQEGNGDANDGAGQDMNIGNMLQAMFGQFLGQQPNGDDQGGNGQNAGAAGGNTRRAPRPQTANRAADAPRQQRPPQNFQAATARPNPTAAATTLNAQAPAFQPAPANPQPTNARPTTNAAANQPQQAQRPAANTNAEGGGFFDLFRRNQQRQNGANPFQGMFMPRAPAQPAPNPAPAPAPQPAPAPTVPLTANPVAAPTPDQAEFADPGDMDLDELPPLERVDSSLSGSPSVASRPSESSDIDMPALVSVSDSEGEDVDEDYEPSDYSGGSSEAWETESEGMSDAMLEAEAQAKREADTKWQQDFRVDESTWSYAEGLPSDITLPIALVNRPFLHAARKALYGASLINMKTVWQLHLFLRTLSEEQVSAFVDDGSSDEEMGGVGVDKARHGIAEMVKGLSWMNNKPRASTLGRGGLSVVVQVLALCKRLKVLKLGANPMKSAWPEFEKALSGLTELEELSIRGGTDAKYPMHLSTERLSALSKNWPNLRVLDAFEISAASTTMPLLKTVEPVACHLTDVQLSHANCTGAELEALLDGSIGHLTSLKLNHPSPTLTRSGLASMLTKHAGTLKELYIGVLPDWHVRARELPPSSSPELSAFLLNTFISQFKKLEALRWDGALANSALFGVLPASIETMAWSSCPAIEPQRVAKLLTAPMKSGLYRLPKLKCVTVQNDDAAWSQNGLNALQKAFEARGICFHPSMGMGTFGMDFGDGMAMGGIPIPIALPMNMGFGGM